MTWILLVTWITPGQPTTSYQTQFSSQQTCTAARDEVLKSALAMRQQMFAEQQSAPYSITSSARASNVAGTWRPISLAVFN
jgi:hypothetical protein